MHSPEILRSWNITLETSSQAHFQLQKQLLTPHIDRSNTHLFPPTRYPQPLRLSPPRTPSPIGRDGSPLRPIDVLKLRREARQVSDRPAGREGLRHSGSHHPDKESRPGDKEKEKRSYGRTNPGGKEAHQDDVGISEAIKDSRRRRAERASSSTPFNDRYRQEERGKAWPSQKP